MPHRPWQTLILRAGSALCLWLALTAGPGATPTAQATPAGTITVTSLSDIPGGPGCILRDAIIAANTNSPTGHCPAGALGADTITFNLHPSCGIVICVIDLGSPLPTVLEDLTISGAGGTIILSGGDTTRLLNVGLEATLHLQHLTLEDANSGASDGGAISNHGNLWLESSTIQDSHTDAAHSGGAIFTNRPVTLTDSLLQFNTGGSGGALFANFGNAVVTISNTTFLHNQAVNTTTTGYGGAIWAGSQAQVTITGGAILTNTAEDGGGIYLSPGATVALLGSAGVPVLISGNLATYAGGGLYDSLGNVTLSNVALQRNSATNADSQVATFGGGIDNYQGAVAITNSTLMSNTANIGGGAFVITGTLSLANTTLAGNTAITGYGGGVGNAGGAVSATQTTFIGNIATADGGGLDNESGSSTLTDTTFFSNTAGGDGGGLVVSFGSATLTGASVISNSAVFNGGGAFVFVGNLTLTSTTLISNTAAGDGGGVFNSSGELALTNSTLTSNTAAGEGGGISDNQTALLTNVSLTDNRAKIGGGLHQDFGTALLKYVTLNGNFASASGGGIATSIFGSVGVTYGAVSGNSAQSGGGIDNENGSQVSLNDVVVSGNSATSYGGGVANAQGNFNATYATLSGNSAPDGAGVDNIAGGVSALTYDTLSDNTASNFGGGIDAGSGSVTLVNSTLSGNAAGTGGGIYDEGAAVALTNATLGGNTAPVAGSLYAFSPLVTETVSLSNTILAAGSSGANCAGPGTIFSEGYNLSSDGTCAAFFTHTGDLNHTNPRLGPLGNNFGPTLTRLPETGSLAIDAIPAGVNGCGTFVNLDQRGVKRPINGRCDIGAVETGFVHPVLWLPVIRR